MRWARNSGRSQQSINCCAITCENVWLSKERQEAMLRYIHNVGPLVPTLIYIDHVTHNTSCRYQSWYQPRCHEGGFPLSFSRPHTRSIERKSSATRSGFNIHLLLLLYDCTTCSFLKDFEVSANSDWVQILAGCPKIWNLTNLQKTKS